MLRISCVQSTFLHVLSLSVRTDDFTWRVQKGDWRLQNSADTSPTSRVISPGLAWYWFGNWGLNRAWSGAPLYEGASPGGLPGGLPGSLRGVLLRVCIVWFPGVLGTRSTPSRVKSQSSGSSAGKKRVVPSEAGFLPTRSRCAEPSAGGLQNLLNARPCRWAFCVQH